MPTLYMMVGLPGSGKSTYLKQLAAKNKDEFCAGKEVKSWDDEYHYIILSTDKYIESVAKSKGSDYNTVFKESIGAAEKELQKDLKEAIKFGFDIYWDQTNLSVRSRARKLSQIPETYRKVAVVIECTPAALEKHLTDRVAGGGKFIDPKIISDMSKQFEFPTTSEGFDEVNSKYYSS
jgi:predicted kinase